jgi:CBS domain-containing protein
MGNLAQILRRRTPVLCVLSYTHTVADAVTELTERGVGALLVVDARERLVGVFSERDLMTRVMLPGRDPKQTALAEVMTPNPVTASPSDDRESALRKMKAAGCRHLPVVVDSTVIDMLSMRDLLFAEIEQRQNELHELRAYISGTY